MLHFVWTPAAQSCPGAQHLPQTRSVVVVRESIQDQAAALLYRRPRWASLPGALKSMEHPWHLCLISANQEALRLDKKVVDGPIALE